VDYHDCGYCNGTGIDEANWDGRCPFCCGSGQVPDVGDNETEDGE